MQDTLKVDDKVSKPDKSPVTSKPGSGTVLISQTLIASSLASFLLYRDITVGDLAAQALITLHLQESFPEDKIVGEEDTTELRKNDGLRGKVVGLVNQGFEKGILGKESQGIWGEGETFSEEE